MMTGNIGTIIPVTEYYGIEIIQLIDSPLTGNYSFIITDAESNKDTVIYNLTNTLDIPRNLFPANNGFLTAENPTFSWDPVPGAITYSIYVNDQNGSVWTRDNITGNSITYNDNGTGQPLSKNASYRFNVSAFYNEGRSWHYDNNFMFVDAINLPDTLDIAYTHEVMSINGYANESVWNTIPPVAVTKNLFGQIEGPDDLSASFKACWNLDSLFVLINITDDSLDNVHGANYWESDKISLYLDMDNSRNTYYDANDWDMNIVWEGGFFPNRTFGGYRFAHLTNEQRDGYQLEIALSLKDLGFPMADIIGLDLDVIDRDGEDPGTAALFWSTKSTRTTSIPVVTGLAI